MRNYFEFIEIFTFFFASGLLIFQLGYVRLCSFALHLKNIILLLGFYFLLGYIGFSTWFF
jgi:hypothetical protein